MAALTRTSSNKSSRPEYKDYVNFLDSYRGNSAKSKENSQDTVDFSRNCPSFNTYLEKYNGKKFSSVKLNLGDDNGKSKTMKSEIFIQVTSPTVNRPKIEKKINVFEKPPLKNKPEIRIPSPRSPTIIPAPPVMPSFKIQTENQPLRKTNNPPVQTEKKPYSSPKIADRIPPPPSMPPPVKHEMKIPANQKLDRNDPALRKLVYGTLRGMYGAYHEKANDFVATLPRNMVKKDNGIQNIINTIASNGDLDKLNGRINPKSED